MLFSERPQIYALCRTISGGRTEQHVIIAGFSATSLALRVIFSGGTTEQHIIIAGFGELAAVDQNTLTFVQYINRIINI